METRRRSIPPRRPLVLIADGHEDTRALYAFALSAIGFDVVPAPSREDAFSRASTAHPDVIVTELFFSGGDGWGFVHDLKHDLRTRDIPVIVLTGFAQPEVRERAELEGCAALFLKPCLPDQLAVGLREVLSRHVCQ